MRFPSLKQVIACNEAVRGPDEISPSADDDDLERVARAVDRAGVAADPVDAAAALAAWAAILRLATPGTTPQLLAELLPTP